MSLPEKKSFPMKVYVRQRPFTKAEVEQKCVSVAHRITPRELTLKMGFSEKKYAFDHVFGGETSQVEVYNVVVAPLINSILAGYNCTVFAYGPTGTGKTHTIFGETEGEIEFNFQTDTAVGLIPRASYQLFSELSKLNLKTEYTIRVSFLEIYNEEVRDLLNENLPLRVYDDPLSKGCVLMKDQTKVTVLNTQDLFNWLSIGLNERQNAATNLNLQSSRSHTLFTFFINIREVTSKGDQIIRTGILNLVDIAGSESAGRSGAVRAREGTINRSRMTLTKVIKALAQKLQHVPYRDSKLTRILQDSLGGNTKTAMIATFSPNASCWDETNVTLELAHIAKTIMNTPHVNVNRKQANLVQELQDEISKLKDELSAVRGGEGFYVSAESYQKMTQEQENNNKKILQLVRQIRELEEHTRAQELHYRNLTESFKKTNDYLVERQQVLLATNEALNRDERKLEEMNLQHQHLSKSARTLLNICQISTTNQDIYHQKYQEKCASNTSNAQITQEMASSTMDCLNAIRLTTQQTQNATQQEQMRKFLEFLQQDHLRDLKEINDLTNLIRTRTEHYQLKMENVLKNNPDDFCLQEVQSFIARMYHQNSEHVKNQSTITQHLNKLKENIQAKIVEVKAKSEQASAGVQDTASEQETLHNSTRSKMINLRNFAIEKQKQLREQLEKDRAMIEILKNEIARAEHEEQHLEEEAAKLPQMMELVAALIDQNNDRQAIHTMRDNVREYMQTANQAMQAQRPVIEDVITNINQNQASLRDSGAEGRERVRQYLDGLVDTAQGNLNQRDNELKRELRNWNSSVGSIQGNVIGPAKEFVFSTQQTLDQMQKTNGSQINNINTSADQTILTLGGCHNRVNPTGHAGDTPVRRTYNIPVKSTGDLRREVLEANLNGANGNNVKDESDKES